MALKKLAQDMLKQYILKMHIKYAVDFLSTRLEKPYNDEMIDTDNISPIEFLILKAFH